MALTDGLINILGLTVQGDLAGFTFYTSKRRQVVFYPIAPPLDPPSPLQLRQRFRFSALATQWTNWEPANRQAYITAAKKVRARFTGYNLYMQAGLTAEYSNLEAVEIATGINLKRPWA